ncbi:sphingomyelin phosphodiesterase-like isoform X1 [Diorhabda sublineata]|uniref:sphingomyelin phosphodiesterase-like isoform X1 n=1 Tax=Diorhabda sublineata TaxID=1163346 RepID=UPI0024E19382|nr:sphingomyelin phosphodiesterase-like isoform X1 [Diorhabda sublineata]
MAFKYIQRLAHVLYSVASLGSCTRYKFSVFTVFLVKPYQDVVNEFRSVPEVVFCLLSLIISTDLVPLNNDVDIDFNDYWNYKITPHYTPLLNGSKNHILPAAYEYEQELRVDPLIEDEEALYMNRLPKKIYDVVRRKIPCEACKFALGLLRSYLNNGDSMEDIKEKVVSLCVSLKIESEIICNSFFDVYAPELVPAFNISVLAPAQTCWMVLGESCSIDIDNNVLHDWSLDIPKNGVNSKENKNIEFGAATVYKVLHLSDVHLDPDYISGSPSNCQEPLCCRNYSTPSENISILPAGRWGSYNKCDSPKLLIENMLKHIVSEHPDIDYIIWTGDLPPHDIWNQTKSSNLNIIRECVEQMLKFFPDTPIFPAVGNHESVPAGSFAPPWMKNEKHNINWLYTTLADHWRRWLPSTSGNTLLHGGFYSVLLRPGFRLISLNTNYCHSLSWWLLVNSTDPAQELKWLIYELQNAEKQNEKVHVIGHIAPGSSDCLKTWSMNYYSIVDRYRHVITGQFYGHSHADEFELFYETKNYSQPINIAYLGPSITTYENHNPAYRIYYVDGDYNNSTRFVLDHETWTTDLEKANEGENEPIWYKLYSARDTYGIQSLSPEMWDKFIDKMAADPYYFNIFYKNYYRDSPTRPYCDSECRVRILCDLKSGRSQDRLHLCNKLQYF